MSSFVKFLFKIPPLSIIPWALHHKRKLPGLLWVGGLGFLAWKRFGPQITARLQEATSAYPAPAEGPWSGPAGGPANDTPTMAVAADLVPANAAPVIGDDEVAPDPAPVTTIG